MRTKNLLLIGVSFLMSTTVMLSCGDDTKENKGKEKLDIDKEVKTPVKPSKEFKVAYIDMDSVSSNYQFNKDVEELLKTKEKNAQAALKAKEDKARASLNAKGQALQNRATKFQKDLQNNKISSQEQYEKEQQAIANLQQSYQAEEEKLNKDYQDAATKLSNDYQDLVMEKSQAINDTIEHFLELYYDLRYKDETNFFGRMSLKTRKKLHKLILLVYIIKNRLGGFSYELIGDKREKTDRPIIYAVTHVGKFDIEVVSEAIKDHYYLLSGDYEHLQGIVDAPFLAINGVIYFNERVKEDRASVSDRMIKHLQAGGNLMYFPEGSPVVSWGYASALFSAAWTMLCRAVAVWRWHSPWLALYIYAVFCIASEITLSGPDLKGMWKGAAAIVVTLFLLNLVPWIGGWINVGVVFVKPYLFLSQIVLAFVLFVDLAFFGVVWLVTRLHA